MTAPAPKIEPDQANVTGKLLEQKIAQELRRLEEERTMSANQEIEEDFGDDDVAETSADIEEESMQPSAVSAFGGATAVRINLRSKLLVTVTAESTPELPDMLRIADGYFSIRSPLRKSKDGVNGSQRDANGLVRAGINDVIEYLAEINNENVVFFGNTDKLDVNIQNMLMYYGENIVSRLYAPFGGTDTVNVKTRATERDADGTEKPVFKDVSLNEAFTFDSWVSYRYQNNELTLFPVFSINIRVPLLSGADAQYKPLINMARALHGIAQRVGLDDSMLFAYAMSSDDMSSPAFLNIMNGLHTDKVPFSVLTVGSVARLCDGEQDRLGIFPAEASFEAACDKLFPFAETPYEKDMLLIF